MRRKKSKKGHSSNIPYHHQVVQEQKEKRKQKRIIKPGPWSNINTGLKVEAKLQKTISNIYFPPYLGKYITHDDGYAGEGYRALVKIVVKDLNNLLKQHGIDEVLCACEKSLNTYKNKKGKKILGDIAILKVRQEKLDCEPPYITCLVKTNKSRISKFMGIRHGILQVF